MPEHQRVDDALVAWHTLVHVQPAQPHGMKLRVERALADETEDRRVEPPQEEDQADGNRMGQAEIKRQGWQVQAHAALCISLISVVLISGARSSV